MIYEDMMREVMEVDSGKYGRSYASHHEMYAVLSEEVQELWQEIRKKNPDDKHLRHEAIQCMAVLYRYVRDLDNGLINE